MIVTLQVFAKLLNIGPRTVGVWMRGYRMIGGKKVWIHPEGRKFPIYRAHEIPNYKAYHIQKFQTLIDEDEARQWLVEVYMHKIAKGTNILPFIADFHVGLGVNSESSPAQVVDRSGLITKLDPNSVHSINNKSISSQSESVK